MDKSVTGLSEFVGAFDDDWQILRVCPVDVVIHGVRDHPRGFADVEEPAVGGGDQTEGVGVRVIRVLHQSVETKVDVASPNLKKPNHLLYPQTIQRLIHRANLVKHCLARII